MDPMKAPADHEHIADKLFLLLDALYNWVKDQHPALVGRLPSTLNAQILYALGEMSYEESSIFDDSIITIMSTELEAQHETCIITDCSICAAVNHYNYIRQIR